MHELIVPSSPTQAQRLLQEIEAAQLREPSASALFSPETPGIPVSSMPRFITDRFITYSFEHQMPADSGDMANFFVNPEAEGTFFDPLGAVSFTRERSALHVDSIADVAYSVFMRDGEHALTVISGFDTLSHNETSSVENYSNMPLVNPEDFLRQASEDPVAAERELTNRLLTPSVGDLVLSEEQKKMREPAEVSFEEADLLIAFVRSLHK